MNLYDYQITVSCFHDICGWLDTCFFRKLNNYLSVYTCKTAFGPQSDKIKIYSFAGLGTPYV